MSEQEKQLELRIKTLEDIEAIKKLKAKYCYSFDEGRLDELMGCFAAECKADYGPRGKAANREELKKLLKGSKDSIPFSNHMVHNPIIDVNGDTATGIWYFEVPATRHNQASWTQGKYEEVYVRENGEWKIKSMVATMFYITPFDQGWVKKQIMDGVAR